MAGPKQPPHGGGSEAPREPEDSGFPLGVRESRRAAPRVRYQHDGTICLTDADADSSPMRILYRDISEMGVGLLCSGYIRPGSRCVAQLKTLDGKAVSVPGEIVRCRCLSEFVNEIGMKFDDLIKLSDFLPAE